MGGIGVGVFPEGEEVLCRRQAPGRGRHRLPPKFSLANGPDGKTVWSIFSVIFKKEKAPAVERPGPVCESVELISRRCLRLAFTLVAAATHGGLVTLGFATTLAILAAAALLAFFHMGFHVLAGAAEVAVLRFTFVLVVPATGHGVLGVGRSVMAAAFGVFHVGHVVMTAAFGLRRWSRVRSR